MNELSYSHSLILCTCPEEKTAQNITQSLLSKRLAACVSRIPGLISEYVWKGKQESSQEILLLIKTLPSQFESIQQEIQVLHPYDVPEIIETPITQGSSTYLQWIDSCFTTQKNKEQREQKT